MASHPCQVLKFPTERGVRKISSNQKTDRGCYLAIRKAGAGAEVLHIKRQMTYDGNLTTSEQIEILALRDEIEDLRAASTEETTLVQIGGLEGNSANRSIYVGSRLLQIDTFSKE